MNRYLPRFAAISVSGILVMLGAYAPTSAAGPVSFSKNVYPLLQKHCVECHLPNGQGHAVSGFSVESYETIMKGTKYGPVIVPGDAISSSLYRLLAGEVDPSIQMPHNKDPLPPADIKLIETWIEQGAKNN